MATIGFSSLLNTIVIIPQVAHARSYQKNQQAVQQTDRSTASHTASNERYTLNSN